MALGTRRRSRRSSIDIWPGFVDALAQLLMVIIFVLLVFTAGQFLLSDALSGRDKALAQLQQQVNELSDLLAVEKRSGAELREGAATVTPCEPAWASSPPAPTRKPPAPMTRPGNCGTLRQRSPPTRKNSSCN